MYYLNNLFNLKRCGKWHLYLKGKLVTVKTLFDYLKEESLEEFLKGFPFVTCRQAEGIIEMVSQKTWQC